MKIMGDYMDDEKFQYLQMIQEVIGRMSTISSVIKGFSITLAVAIVTILSGDLMNDWMVWIFILPLISLIALDIYYLALEKKYRALYEDVRTNKHPVDYSLTLAPEISNKVSIWNCLRSKSILMFHLPIVLMYLLTYLSIK